MKKILVAIICILMVTMLALTACSAKKTTVTGGTQLSNAQGATGNSQDKPTDLEATVPEEDSTEPNAEDTTKAESTDKPSSIAEPTEKPQTAPKATEKPKSTDKPKSQPSQNWQATVVIRIDEESKADLNGDGKYETVRVYRDGGAAKIEVMNSDGKVVFSQENKYFDVEAYIVDLVKGDGKQAVLYGFMDESSPVFRGFHLDKKEKTDSISFDVNDGKSTTFNGLIGAVKGKLTMSFPIELFGTRNIYTTAEYNAKTNTIEAKSKDYSFVDNGQEDLFYENKTLKDINATDSKGNAAVIKAGSKMYPVKTDNKTYVTVEVRDIPSLTFTIKLEVKNGYEYYLDGVHQDKIFAGLAYCG